jgi:hypothetical protein
LGERCAGPTQPRDHSQILGILYVFEIMVGGTGEFRKRQHLSPRVYGARAADNWCRNTDSDVTTRIEIAGIRCVHLGLHGASSKRRHRQRKRSQ